MVVAKSLRSFLLMILLVEIQAVVDVSLGENSWKLLETNYVASVLSNIELEISYNEVTLKHVVF